MLLLIGGKKKKSRKKKDEINTILSQMLHFQGEMNNNVATKDCKITAFDRNSVWDDKYLRFRVDSGMDVQGTLSVLFCFWRKYGISRKMANTKYCSQKK